MNPTLDLLLTDLRHLIAELGHHDGLISPSVYDTAQVLRLAPPAEGVWPALEWLLAQQHADGGWGCPDSPRARDLPTMAALLTADMYGAQRAAREALRRGLAFMARQAYHWSEPLGADLTIGLELLLPPLLEQAGLRGLPVSSAPYSALIALGKRRRAMIAAYQPGPGTTPLHSWEGWGQEPDPELLDPFGSIGHNPAATAAWLHRALARPGLADHCVAARTYLARAACVTGEGLPGVVPTCWPLPRFEQVFTLQALYLGGLLGHPALAAAVAPQLDALEVAFTPRGIGFSDHFTPDGDDTAAAIAVLLSAGRQVDPAALMRYACDDHFCAYHNELHPSYSVTAHAIHVLRLLGADTTPYEGFLVAHQLSDGRWTGDKWNCSWLYTTWRSMVALSEARHPEALQRATGAILSHQQPDGGWGTGAANPEETAYAVLALRSLSGNVARYDQITAALARGDRWLRTHYRPFAASSASCWIGKEPFRPLRIVRAIELTALLSGLLDGGSSPRACLS